MQNLTVETAAITSLLPVLMVFIPLLGSLGVLFCAKSASKNVRNTLVVSLTAIPLLIAVRMFFLLEERIIEYNVEWFLEIGLIFRVDQFSFIFVALISLIWFLATLYALEYISHEHNQNRFYFFWLVTFGSTLGVFVTGDLFGLFLFFEIMSLSSYVLVIHEENKEAMRAGNLYLFLGIGGGLSILLGLFILYFNLDTLEITPQLGEIVAAGVNIPLVLILFIIGFGIKAGMVPLHIWLPKAHPVAPTPASAILSGLLIKTGVYGIWRVFLVLMGPETEAEITLYEHTISVWGMGLFWVGIMTMLLGALMALLQNQAKVILAYSSVSQIGFIILALGTAIYLGPEGPIGFAGGLMHIMNHAFFKASLFLIVGAIFIRTHVLDIDRVRGMFKQAPYMGVTFIIAALGIAGIPLFNGYASKTIIHHALTEVSYMSPGLALEIADKIFVFTSALTVSYFIKLFRGMFLGQLPEEWKQTDFSVAPIIKVVLTVFSVMIIAIGFFPNFVLGSIIVPAFTTFPYYGEVVHEQLYGMDLFTSKDLFKVVTVLLIAGAITLADVKFQVSRVKVPEWLSIEALIYQPAITNILSGIEKLGTSFDVSVNDLYESTSETSFRICRKISELDESLDSAYSSSSKGARHAAQKTADFEEGMMDLSQTTGYRARDIARKSRQLDKVLEEGYDKTISTLRPVTEEDEKDATEMLKEELDRAYQRSGKVSHYVTRARKQKKGLLSKLQFDPNNVTVKNLNFDSFVIILVLGISLLVLVFYDRIFP